jgi:hypothetical protein
MYNSTPFSEPQRTRGRSVNRNQINAMKLFLNMLVMITHHLLSFRFSLSIFARPKTMPLIHRPNKSSSSSSHPLFLRVITIFCSSSSFRCDSAIAFNNSFSWSSVTFCRNWPVCASMISRFSISVARDSFTSRMRPRRSAASGSRIWLRIVARRSAMLGVSNFKIRRLEFVALYQERQGHILMLEIHGYRRRPIS